MNEGFETEVEHTEEAPNAAAFFLGHQTLDEVTEKIQKNGTALFEKRKARAKPEAHKALADECLREAFISEIRPLYGKISRPDFRAPSYWLDNLFKAVTTAAVLAGGIWAASQLTQAMASTTESEDTTTDDNKETTANPFGSETVPFTASTRPSRRVASAS